MLPALTSVPTVNPRTAPGARFGAAIGSLAKNGKDKLTIITHPSVSAFGAWAEQLIAESTGKKGTGIVPIEGEKLDEPGIFGLDRVFVYQGANLPNPDPNTERFLQKLQGAGFPVIRLAMNDALDLGEAFYLWEIATAAAGSVLGINAFDQPNVQESKDNTKRILDEFHAKGSINEPPVSKSFENSEVTFLSGSASIKAEDVLDETLANLFQTVKKGDYVAICAYIARDDGHIKALDDMRLGIREALNVATTVGFGPRFLHSTGQLHKGGPDEAFMIQIVAHDPHDPPIPGMNVGFRTLLAAQALGDFQSLDQRKRRGVRITLKGDLAKALAALGNSVGRALSLDPVRD